MKVFYSTITGTAKLFAQQLAESAVARGLPEPKLIDIVDYDTEDFLTESNVSIFILSTYNVEGPNDWFLKWLEDTRFDWRVERESLSKLKFSVFGLGDSAYSDEFCNGPRSADKWLGQLGAQRVWPFGEGDKNAGNFHFCSASNHPFCRFIALFNLMTYFSVHVHNRSGWCIQAVERRSVGLALGPQSEPCS